MVTKVDNSKSKKPKKANMSIVKPNQKGHDPSISDIAAFIRNQLQH